MSNQQHKQDIIAMQANLEVVAGPAAAFSDHKAGETITYHASSSEVRTGIILYVSAPQQIISQHVPLSYLVDCGIGFPDVIYQSDIIEPPL
jgi:hypothetical protein